MFGKLRNRFGIPGVISVMALVLAMAGGAYAAKKYVITSTSQIKPSVLKSLKGKPGPAGPQGPQGAPGSAGANGKDGSNGTNGTNGTSVTGTAFSGSEGGCTEGGVKFTSASGPNYACNGKKGTTGFTSTLPAGKTETGTWGGFIGPSETLLSPVSFSIPLAEDLEASDVHFINEAGKEVVNGTTEVDSTVCLGSAEEPTATAGNLCVYARYQEVKITNQNILNPGTEFGNGAAVAGALISMANATANEVPTFGTWAVTG
jgi:hypothetical protein